LNLSKSRSDVILVESKNAKRFKIPSGMQQQSIGVVVTCPRAF